jgi:hypothetical protein
MVTELGKAQIQLCAAGKPVLGFGLGEQAQPQMGLGLLMQGLFQHSLIAGGHALQLELP